MNMSVHHVDYTRTFKDILNNKRPVCPPGRRSPETPEDAATNSKSTFLSMAAQLVNYERFSSTSYTIKKQTFRYVQHHIWIA